MEVKVLFYKIENVTKFYSKRNFQPLVYTAHDLEARTGGGT
jgi:hypothetical protein